MIYPWIREINCPICSPIPTAEETGLEPVQSEFESLGEYKTSLLESGFDSRSVPTVPGGSGEVVYGANLVIQQLDRGGGCHLHWWIWSNFIDYNPNSSFRTLICLGGR